MGGPFEANRNTRRCWRYAFARRPCVSRKARLHNEKWLPWLSEEIARLGIEVTPSAGNFVPVMVRKRREEARMLDSHQSGLMLRRMMLRPADAVRLTVGTEEANRLVVQALKDFMEQT